MSKAKRIQSLWFTEMGATKPIGIVLVSNEFGDKAYIGTGYGFSQETDEQTIARTGVKFPLPAARKLFDVEEK